ncbi:MAG: GH92 family glycosyl hydrolase, partial [Bifidobacteriaceae bacterium]|nr:GH92 family glycosyl hydrolase [Bifidobacteriaceae bacterium]
MREQRRRAPQAAPTPSARRPVAGIAALAVAASLIGGGALALGPAAAQPAPGDLWSSGFEDPAAPPFEANPYEPPVNMTGWKYQPGSLMWAVAAVTSANDYNASESAPNLVDGASGTKWLSNIGVPTWARYQMSEPIAPTKYSITSANDAEDRDPTAWRVEGSDDAGQTWVTIDTRTGQTFTARYQTLTYTIDPARVAPYSDFRLTITARRGTGAMMQIADWLLYNDATTVPDEALTNAVGNGPMSGYNIKSSMGWTGAKALGYGGGIKEPGDASYANTLYSDLDVTIGADTELAYMIFPVHDEANLTWAATYAAIDLEITDADGSNPTRLSQTAGITDQYGFGASPQAQGESKVLYGSQWNSVRFSLGSLAGKKVTKVLLAYKNPAGAPRAPTGMTTMSGWIDDIALRPAKAIDPSSILNYVDTRRGTHASGSFSRGNNIPAATWPNGFNFWTPMQDATSTGTYVGYNTYNNSANLPTIEGFGISHETSIWMGDRNSLSVMPGIQTAATGSVSASAASRELPYDRASEVARADIYSVNFINGLKGEMAPTDHAGVMRFTWPDSTTGTFASLLVDPVSTSTTGADIAIDAATGQVTGFTAFGSGLSTGYTRMFVYGEFDRAPAAAGAATSRTRGDYARFDVTTDKDVELRLATSFISREQAQRNFDLEVRGRTFDQIHQSAKDAWLDRLSVIDVTGSNATDVEKVNLYSSLYRLNMYPNSMHENTGTAAAPVWKHASPVKATVGAATATQTNAQVIDGKIYVNNGFWDTYRTAWPAYAFFYPDLAQEMVDGFVQQYREGGWVSRWSSPGYADLMTGTSSDASFAEAYVAGALPTDKAIDAFDAAIKNATVLPTAPYSSLGANNVGRKGLDISPFIGYTASSTGQSVSWGMEGLINDKAIAYMGEKLLADPETPPQRLEDIENAVNYLHKRAEQTVNLFDEAAGGFFRERPANGTFLNSATFDPKAWSGGYTEASGWNFSFHAPYDTDGLAALYGGQQGLLDKLDEFFTVPEKADYSGIHEAKEARDVRMGQWGFSNQLAHHIPWIYADAGRPSQTQAIVREVLARMYVGSEIGQGYAGDEDNGEQSSWYLFASMGFYPLSEGSGGYAIGSPLLDKMVVNRGSQGKLAINAPGNNHDSVYLAGVEVDGQPITEARLEMSAINDAADDVLEYSMSTTPTAWGETGDTAAPFAPLTDTTKPAFGSLASADREATGALVDDNSRTTVTFSSTAPELTWTSKAGSASVVQYTITSGPAGRAAPKAWKLYGSFDGSNWTQVDARTGQEFRWPTQTRPYTLAAPATYTRFRLEVTASSQAGTAPTMAEFELLEDVAAPAGDLAVYPISGLKVLTGAAETVTVATVSGGTGDPADYAATVHFDSGPQPGIVTAGERGALNVAATTTETGIGLMSGTVSLTFTDPADPANPATVAVPFSYRTSKPTLEASFDGRCLTELGTAVDCDGNGIGLSIAGLANPARTQPIPWVQGTTVTVATGPAAGLKAYLPVTQLGRPDNLMATGKTFTVDLAPDVTTIALIGFANEGQQSATGTITYTDATTQAIPMSFGDWTGAANAPIAGTSLFTAINGRQTATGSDSSRTGIYITDPVTLAPGKTVESISVPDFNHTPKQGQIHLFAIATDGSGLPPAVTLEMLPTLPAQVAYTPMTAVLGEIGGGAPGATLSATVNWGDGTPNSAATITDGKVIGTHIYATSGTYTITVVASDGTATTAEGTVAVRVAGAGYEPKVTPSQTLAAPGDTLTVAGTGFAPSERVRVQFTTAPAIAQTVTASASGAFSTTLEIPDWTSGGTYPVTALGEVSNVLASESVVVFPRKTDPALTLAASASTGLIGTPVTLTAAIDVNILGSIEFWDGATPLGAAAVDSDGVAELTTAPFTVAGAHSLTARYSGDTFYNSTVSNAVDYLVTKPVYTPSITVGGGGNVNQGANLTLTGTGFAPSEAVTVTFSPDFGVTGHANASASGAVNLGIAIPMDTAPRAYTITATGAESEASASGSVTVVYVKRSIQTVLTVAPAGLTPTTPVTLTAHLSLPATGSVDFRDGSLSLGSAAVDGFIATLELPGIGVGTHGVTAYYSGDSVYNPSTSNFITVTVTADPPPGVDIPALVAQLAGLVDVGAELVEADYAPAAWAAYERALIRAQGLLLVANPREADLVSAIAALSEALAALPDYPAPPGIEELVAQLQGLVDLAAGLAEDDYAPAAWAAYERALDRAEAVLAKASPTELEVTVAIVTLGDAFAALAHNPKPEP